MALHPLAGQPAPRELLVNIPRLVSAYYTLTPDPENVAHRVAFGTSGHRGSSLKNSFNEHHILAISQAIAEYRQSQGIDGPIFVGMDTHALSEPAQLSAVEVLAANDVEVVIQRELGYTPTPVISHAILTYNRGRHAHLADGIVITPVAQPAGRRRDQVQPAEWRPGRRGRHQRDPGSRQSNLARQIDAQ